jgi:ankyrin repeat protein
VSLLSTDVDAFLAAVQEQDLARAKAVLESRREIAATSLHVAAVIGDAATARRLIAEDRARLSETRSEVGADPLTFLCYSPFYGESAARDAALLETARVLLDAGADPNARDAQFGVTPLYAVTGQRVALPLANLLLDAGASPNDGESMFHAAERFHLDAMELLLARGCDLNYVGDWGNTALHFLVRWHDLSKPTTTRRGFDWLLGHGADPNVRCGKEQETSLHLAARRGQSAEVVQVLLDHRAEVNAERGDGRTAWQLAKRGGFEKVALVLERAGARPELLSPLDALLEACGRGDAEEARRLSTRALIAELSEEEQQMLPNAVSAKRFAAVHAYVAAGWPIDVPDAYGGTAIHYAAFIGRAALVRALAEAGADLTIRDRQHHSTPLGWAMYASEVNPDPDGDYLATVEAFNSLNAD